MKYSNDVKKIGYVEVTVNICSISIWEDIV